LQIKKVKKDLGYWFTEAFLYVNKMIENDLKRRRMTLNNFMYNKYIRVHIVINNIY